MKSPDLPLHDSNSFQRSFRCPKYSREISPRSHFTPQHREQLVLMALNRSPYDARVTPPKQRRGARGNGAGRCVRQTTCLADAICTRYLGWSGRYCSIPAVWGLREETVEGNHLAKCSRGRGGRWALEGGRHLFPKRPRPTSRRQHSSLPHSKGG